MRARIRPLLLGCALLTAAVAAGAEPADGVPYPTGYRGWAHVKSMVIQEGHPLFGQFGGIHHVYANERAREGYRTGRFPDGSVLVFDLLEALTENGAIVEGPRKVLGVMVRDRARFEATGGWGFEAFAGGDPARPALGREGAADCFECHRGAADHDFVFSRWRD